MVYACMYECGVNGIECLGSPCCPLAVGREGWSGIAPCTFVEVPAAVVAAAVLTSVDGCCMGGVW